MTGALVILSSCRIYHTVSNLFACDVLCVCVQAVLHDCWQSLLLLRACLHVYELALLADLSHLRLDLGLLSFCPKFVQLSNIVLVRIRIIISTRTSMSWTINQTANPTKPLFIHELEC